MGILGYIKGKPIYYDKTKIILVDQSIGYEINYELNKSDDSLPEKIELFIVHKSSEYGETLFGFDTLEQKKIFEFLDTIKGVGSKAIFSIISQLQLKTFGSLQKINIDELIKVPGIGKSSAQKFLLGLSTKLKSTKDLEEIISSSKVDVEVLYKAEITMLKQLGMNKSSIIDILTIDYDNIKDKRSEDIIRYILQSANKKV